MNEKIPKQMKKTKMRTTKTLTAKLVINSLLFLIEEVDPENEEVEIVAENIQKSEHYIFT